MFNQSGVSTAVSIISAVLLIVFSRCAFAEAPLVPPQPAAGIENRVVYPPIAARLKQQGNVGVAVYVAEDGLVTDARITKSSGFPQLDAAALISVGYWHYQSGLRDGNPVGSWRDDNVDFRLPTQAGPTASLSTTHALDLAQVKGSGVQQPVTDPSFEHYGQYPALAWWRRDQGKVKILALIGEDGWISDAKIETSSGSAQLDAAALISVGYWHYFPAKKDGKTVAAWWEIEFAYMPPTSNAPMLMPDIKLSETLPLVTLKQRPPGITPPKPVGPPHTIPFYPPIAIRNDEQGIVGLLVTIQQDGSVSDPIVVRPCSFHDLNAVAISAVKDWRYSPAEKDGKTMPVRSLVEVVYLIPKSRQRPSAAASSSL